MRLTRCHAALPLAIDATVELPPGVAAHLVRVLRLGDGAAVVLFNGNGYDYRAELFDVGKRGAHARILGREPVTNEAPWPLVLVQSLLRGEKMDFVLQKATELGVSAIIPVTTEFGGVRLDAERGDKRQQHWQAVVAAACEQCGRARLPQIAPVMKIADWLARWPETGLDADPAQPGQRLPVLYLDPEAVHGPRELPGKPGTGACFVVGPEGGLGPGDRAALDAAGAVGLRLGPRVLRTETAGLAALAAAQALWGDY